VIFSAITEKECVK